MYLTLNQAGPDEAVPSEFSEFLDKVASRLFSDGFSVNRKVQAGLYNLDTLATRPLEGTIKAPWYERTG